MGLKVTGDAHAAPGASVVPWQPAPMRLKSVGLSNMSEIGYAVVS